MRGYAKYFAGALIGVLLIVWGFVTFGKSETGPGELALFTGSLELVEGAEDPLFDIYVDSPVLIRKVEMYQNYTDSAGYVQQDFFDSKKTVLEKDLNDSYAKDASSFYKNPSFPSDMKSEVFYGKVRIGDEDIYLSEEYLHKFSMGSYIDFEKENRHQAISGLEDGPRVKDLVPYDDYSYATVGGRYWEVGDLLVTWYGYDPADFAEVYTAAGDLEGDIIGPKEDSYSFFYDKILTLEEIDQQFRSRMYKTGIGLGVVGGLVLILSAFFFIKARKKWSAATLPADESIAWSRGGISSGQAGTKADQDRDYTDEKALLKEILVEEVEDAEDFEGNTPDKA